MNRPDATGSILAMSWFRRAVWVFGCAAAWVALEMMVGRLLTGFPWDFLGVSQFQMLPLIQIASVTGVYGVSFLVAWFSVALLCATLAVVRWPTAWWAWGGELLLPLLTLVAVVFFGFQRVARGRAPAGEVKVALVQPSIPQTLIWDPRQNPVRFERIMQLSRLAAAAHPDLLVWPEAALPEFSAANFEALTNLIAARRVWMLLGAEDAVRNRRAAAVEPYLYFNAAFLLDPAGEPVATYHKRHLVIFGEYVPFERWLPFLRHLTPIDGNFTAGTRPVQFRLNRPQAQFSVLICFEDTFPALARASVNDQTDFLVNLTNDGWFGDSAAQWQHAANALFRAVELGLPLVRCANNGLTCWFDAWGRMHDVRFKDGRSVYAAGFKTARIPVPPPSRGRAVTFYRRHGDWFGWACVGVAAMLGGLRLAGWARNRAGRAGTLA